MRGEVHILVYCPIDTLQWGSTHSGMVVTIHASNMKYQNATRHPLHSLSLNS